MTKTLGGVVRERVNIMILVREYTAALCTVG